MGRPHHRRKDARVVRASDAEPTPPRAPAESRTEMVGPIPVEIPTIGRLLQDGRVLIGERLRAMRAGEGVSGRELRDLMSAAAVIRDTEAKAREQNLEGLTRDEMRAALRAELDRLDAEANASIEILPTLSEGDEDELP